MYTMNQLKNYATILKSGKETFWASDFGFRGGDIGGLSYDFIEPTGNTKEVLIPIGGDCYKKVEAQEWRLRKNHDLVLDKILRKDVEKSVKLLFSAADLYRELGY